MEKVARDFLNKEFDYFQKLAELQYTHFMQVFLFWTAVVIAPITAGLLVEHSNGASSTNLPILLVGIAVLGFFIAAKMFDIRCSQLTYIATLNYFRAYLYEDIKDHLPKSYKHQFPPEDLRKKALNDFGIIMAFTMSVVHGFYLGYGLPRLLLCQSNFDWQIFICSCLVGIGMYFLILLWRGPKPQNKK